MSSGKQSLNITGFKNQNEEIGLTDIIRLLIYKKNIFISVTFFVFFIGVVYAFGAKRIYQADTLLEPPGDEIIQSFNVENFQDIKADVVFSDFNKIIMSINHRQKFFEEFDLLSLYADSSLSDMTKSEMNEVFEDFNDSIKIVTKVNTEISLKAPDEKKAGEVLDNFVKFSNEIVINKILYKLRSNIALRINEIRKNIESKKKYHAQIRKDELLRLNEDLLIAKSLGINERYDGINTQKDKNNFSIYMNGQKRYLEGAKILQAEINSLRNRKSDDIHIAGLRKLQAELDELEAIDIKKGKLQSIIMAKNPIVNIKAVRPQRVLVLFMSIIIGSLLGFFVILILEFIEGYKRNSNIA